MQTRKSLGGNYKLPDSRKPLDSFTLDKYFWAFFPGSTDQNSAERQWMYKLTLFVFVLFYKQTQMSQCVSKV